MNHSETNLAAFKRRIQVLVVDDNQGDAKLVKEMLAGQKTSRFQLSYAQTVSDGQQHLKDCDVDIILLDLSLPDSSGLQTYLTIRKSAVDIPVVVLSGQNDETLAIQAVQSGAQDYLIKGEIDGRLLSRAIRYAIERQRLATLVKSARRVERYNAYFDALTSLPNRKHFCDAVNNAIANVKDHSDLVAVMLFDLDDFQRINKNLGHDAGNRILQAVTGRIRSNLRATDIVARVGGDEFTALLREIDDARNIAIVGQKIIKAFEKPFEIYNLEVTMTVSIGVSVYPGSGEDAEALLKNADISMFDAKINGKNRLRFYENAMGESSSRRFALESRLKKACDENEFVVFYQPQFDSISGGLCGIEALVRWNHPELGLLSPKMFIPIAEDNGMIISIGEQILYKVCKEIKEWLGQGLPHVPVFVNISARQFLEGDLPNTLARVLERTDLSPEHLGIEITESNSMQDVGYTIDTLKKLKDMGVRISIDDFGTGYSSLSYLKRFPLDTLKIDQSFVHGIPRDQENMAIIKAIVNLAHSLDLKVVAEGVETAAQIAFLRSQQCDELQGFHFSKPVSGERVRKILRRARARNKADATPKRAREPIVVKDEHLIRTPGKRIQPCQPAVIDFAGSQSSEKKL